MPLYFHYFWVLLAGRGVETFEPTKLALAMRTQTALRPVANMLLMAIFGNTTALLAARDHIEIRGRLLLDGEALADAMLVVEVDDQDCIPFNLFPDGRFELSLPIDAKANIRFEKPGYMSKDVAVDTRNALRTNEAIRKNKLVRFDVQLQPEPRNERMYAKPVGSITFAKGSGLMKVQHDRTVIDTPNAGAAIAPKKDGEE